MLELSAFASLAQFGAGLGLALSFFLEPVTARARRLRLELDSELSLIPQSSSQMNDAKRSEVFVKIINLDSNYKNALSKAKYPLISIRIGCALNLAILILCTIVPDSELDLYWVWTLLLASIGPIALASALLFYVGFKYIPKPS